MSQTLRSKVIRLAHQNPDLRTHLLPLLKQAMEFATPEALEKYLKAHPKSDKSKHRVKKDVSHVPEKHPSAVQKDVGKMSPDEVQDAAKSLPKDRKERYDAVLKELGGDSERNRQNALLQVKSEDNYKRVETDRKPKTK